MKIIDDASILYSIYIDNNSLVVDEAKYEKSDLLSHTPKKLVEILN